MRLLAPAVAVCEEVIKDPYTVSRAMSRKRERERERERERKRERCLLQFPSAALSTLAAETKNADGFSRREHAIMDGFTEVRATVEKPSISYVPQVFCVAVRAMSDEIARTSEVSG